MNEEEIKLNEMSDYYNVYIVEKNESLFTLAKNKNLNPNLLAVLNGLDPTDYVFKEQKIFVPKSDFSYYITKEGDTVNGVAEIFSANVNNIPKDNLTIYLKEGQLIVSRKR